MKVNLEGDLIERISTSMQKEGIVFSAVEGGCLEVPNQGRLLIINFLPFSDALSNGIKAVENTVQAIIDFLVHNRYTKEVNRLQIAVNVKSEDRCHVLIKYWCDEAKLRELERCRFPFSKLIMRKPFREVISGSLSCGVPLEGFFEWGYRINGRSGNGVDVSLYRMGEGSARFTLNLCESEAIPVAVLREEASRIEYEIQRMLNARFYKLEATAVGDNDEGRIAFTVAPPNIYVLKFIRTFAVPFANGTKTGWLLMDQNMKSFVEVLRNERIRVLEVKEFLSNERGSAWQEDGVVWKVDDMCSPTKGNVAASLKGLHSVMEHDLNSSSHARAYHLLFDCRPLQSSSPLP